jgi:predicted MPP superfamily phosphohydrolase
METQLDALKEILIKQGRLISLPPRGKVVFIGDTHGDFEATKLVFKQFFKDGYILVFLGDYVDRGEDSKGNIEFLLKKKVETPEGLFLLMGNHEGYPLLSFYPADFWEGLSASENDFFSKIFKFLPFVVWSENGLIAVHGVLPDVSKLEEIDKIELGSNLWQQITWGDFAEKKGEFLGNLWGRPLYGEDYFDRTMKQLGGKVLLRAHQPHISSIIFKKHCLTLITSHAYKPLRQIAIADLEKSVINSVDELEILEI